MDERDGCRRELLAQARFGNVQRCDCGAVHLSIGGTTLRLPVAALGPLRALLEEAEEAEQAREEADRRRRLLN